MLTYRQMSVDDVPSVFLVRLATVENAITLEEMEADYGVTHESVAAAIKSDVSGWLCEDGDNVVGFAMGDRSSGEVQVVAVLPDYQGRGLGKTVLMHVQHWLFSHGHDEIWLLANPDPTGRATGFYRRLGWQRTGVMKGRDEVLKLRNPVSKSVPFN